MRNEPIAKTFHWSETSKPVGHMQQAPFPDTLVVYYGLISLLEINSMTPRREENQPRILGQFRAI